MVSDEGRRSVEGHQVKEMDAKSEVFGEELHVIVPWPVCTRQLKSMNPSMFATIAHEIEAALFQGHRRLLVSGHDSSV